MQTVVLTQDEANYILGLLQHELPPKYSSILMLVKLYFDTRLKEDEEVKS